MKLFNSNSRNINILKKALYAEQLSSYAQLCRIYKKLAETHPDLSPEQIEQRYSGILTAITQGNISIEKAIDNKIRLYDENGSMITDHFSQKEKNLFKTYLGHANNYKDFADASKLLTIATGKKSDKSDPAAYANFEKFMQESSNKTQLFYTKMGEHSPTFNAFSAYVRARSAVETITTVDSSHIDQSKVAESLKPETFGATIKGCRTNVLTAPLKSADSKVAEAEDKFKAIKAERAIKRFYTKHRSAIRKVFAGVMAAGLIFIAGQHMHNAHEFANLNIDTAQEQGYQIVLQQDTRSEISRIEAAIDAAQSSPTTPTYEELSAIRYDLDEVIDGVMTDLVTDAFEEAHPEYNVTNVETRYDKTVNQGKSPNSEPAKENTITITYTDEKGETQTVNVQNFSATSLLHNSIEQSFNDEYKLDGLYPSAPSPDKTFLENDQAVNDLLTEYEGVLGNIKQLAATKFVFRDGNFIVDPSIKAVTPDKIEVSDITVNETLQRDTDDRDDR